METNQTEEKAGYPEWLGLLRLMEPEDKKEREAVRMGREKTEEKKPKKAKKKLADKTYLINFKG